MFSKPLNKNVGGNRESAFSAFDAFGAFGPSWLHHFATESEPPLPIQEPSPVPEPGSDSADKWNQAVIAGPTPGSTPNEWATRMLDQLNHPDPSLYWRVNWTLFKRLEKLEASKK